jgi:hypothetical protein
MQLYAENPADKCTELFAITHSHKKGGKTSQNLDWRFAQDRFKTYRRQKGQIMKTNLLCSVIFAMGTPFMAMAQSTQGVLVELFTSQGCSSCPPADAFLADLTKSANVIPLALHVDYWDYIGWKDTFAQKKFSARQRSYAAFIDDKMVYTPQMIIAGNARIKGHNAAEAKSNIAASKSDVALTLTRQGDQVLIQARANQPLPAGIMVDLVRYHPKSTVQIERGENRGQAISYHNIVTSWENVGQWSGKSPLELTTRATGDAPIVVILQRKGPSAILAAAVLK